MDKHPPAAISSEGATPQHGWSPRPVLAWGCNDKIGSVELLGTYVSCLISSHRLRLSAPTGALLSCSVATWPIATDDIREISGHDYCAWIPPALAGVPPELMAFMSPTPVPPAAAAGPMTVALRQMADRIPRHGAQGGRISEQDTKRILISPTVETLHHGLPGRRPYPRRASRSAISQRQRNMNAKNAREASP